MRRKSGQIAGLLWLASLLSSWGGDSAAFRVLRIPASEAPGLRAALRDPAVGTQEASMEKLVKSRNLEVLAEFRQNDPWVGRPVHLEKSMGGIENGGELMELGVKLEIEGSVGHPDVRNGVEITLPAGGKKALFRQALWSGTRGPSGSWVERCCCGRVGPK